MNTVVGYDFYDFYNNARFNLYYYLKAYTLKRYMSIKVITTMLFRNNAR